MTIIVSITGQNINFKPLKWEDEQNLFDKAYGFSEENLKKISFALREAKKVY